MSWDPRDNWNVDIVQPVNRLCSLNRGLVAWWLGIPGLTGGSRFIDVVSPGPNGNHGTSTNMDPATDWVPGERGGMVLDLDGSDDYVAIATPPVTGKPLAFSCWFRVPDTANTYNLVSVGNSAESLDDYIRLIARQGALRYQADDGDGTNVEGPSYSANNWHFAACTVTAGGAVAVYLDNASLTGSESRSPSGVDNAAIGKLATTYAAQTLLGQINDVRIWNRAPTAAEVLDAYLDSLTGYRRTLRRMGGRFPAAGVVAGGGAAPTSHLYGSLVGPLGGPV